MKQLIYIADDENNIRNLLKTFLENDGYAVKTFATGDDLLCEFRKEEADLVILDLMMPGRDGMECCKELRSLSSIPIIILTARDSELDYVQGISIGSDDYLTKPFKPTVLLMKVKALLRRMEMDRNPEQDLKPISFGDILYQPEKNFMTCKNKRLELTQIEFRVLAYMLKNTEKVCSREELLDKVWGYESLVETRVTDETIRRIRRKLAEQGSLIMIETVWGFGYRLTREQS